MKTNTGKFIQRILIVGLLWGSSNAMAVSYTSNFSAAGTGGNGGFYYFIGQNALQTFTSGLTSVDQMDLTLNLGSPYGNSALQTLGFTFYLDNTIIGTTSYAPGDNSVHSLDFTFSPLTSSSGDWALAMDVTQPVCLGCESVQFSTNNPVTLISAVPEPSTYAMMLTGLVLIGFMMSRKKTAKIKINGVRLD